MQTFSGEERCYIRFELCRELDGAGDLRFYTIMHKNSFGTSDDNAHSEISAKEVCMMR